jgi:hypothetical protein
MLKENRLEFSIFFLLILIGSWFLLDRFIPEFHAFASQYAQWPRILILIGVVAFLFGIILGSPDMFVPAMVIGGVGWILAYQETHGGLASWSYMWTLIPGFVGAGMIVAGLFGEEDTSQDIKYGFMLMGASAVLFVIFAALFSWLNLFGN